MGMNLQTHSSIMHALNSCKHQKPKSSLRFYFGIFTLIRPSSLCITAIVGIPFIATAGPLDTSGFFFLLLAGILCALTYTLYAAASTGLSALETVLLPIIDPVMNPVWVFPFSQRGSGKQVHYGRGRRTYCRDCTRSLRYTGRRRENPYGLKH